MVGKKIDINKSAASTESLTGMSLRIWIAIFSLVLLKILGEHISYQTTLIYDILYGNRWRKVFLNSFVYTLFFLSQKMIGYIWLSLKGQNLSLFY